MNPIIAAVVEKNSTDIKTIIEKIGIETAIALLPNLLAIAKTAQEAAAVPAA